VREFDVARRLARFALAQQSPPKNVDSRLIMLRDPDVLRYNDDQLRELARQIRDYNFRIFVAGSELVLIGGGKAWRGSDAFALFDSLLADPDCRMDSAHAFYLGFETCKASIARLLGKDYRQDEALRWGLLTEEEPDRHRLRRPGSAGGGPLRPSESRPRDER
jgi:hypothetical protein